MSKPALTPKLIVLLAINNYLTETQIKEIYTVLGSKKVWQGKSLIILLTQYFDFEQLRCQPLIWQDIWVYNYLYYECNKTINPFNLKVDLTKVSLRFRRTKLITDYEEEIILPQLNALREANRIISLV